MNKTHPDISSNGALWTRHMDTNTRNIEKADIFLF
ncbi:hypothetical protein E2C01_033409 [Portunus trituberculatus]|uniref:Uncharacterized protein n=1 Tax=Portunus trituberculatus TaxID=210409 RepID=A0A5B7F3N7_PORTR|nr:hypothetical protein [Portunus trituberculatus]